MPNPISQIAGVVTQSRTVCVGRGQDIQTSPVKDAAAAAGIAVYQPGKIRSDEGYEYFQRAAPDAVVIIAYGQIISQRLVAIPRLGWINLHASLLPKYRGAAPIHWAIVNGEQTHGAHNDANRRRPRHRTDAAENTTTEIGADETAPQLTARLPKRARH